MWTVGCWIGFVDREMCSTALVCYKEIVAIIIYPYKVATLGEYKVNVVIEIHIIVTSVDGDLVDVV